jgi:hypothetical protein
MKKKEKTLAQLGKENTEDGIYMSPFTDEKENVVREIHSRLRDLFRMINDINKEGRNFFIVFKDIDVGLTIRKNPHKKCGVVTTLTFWGDENKKKTEYKTPFGVIIRKEEIA